MVSANLRAFLALIRWAEGTSGPDGYRTIVGGDLFTDFSDHPRIRKSGVFHNGKAWSSDASGGYQFLSSTWDECKRALDLPDFSPESQDAAAVYLIKRRGALHAVEEGDLHNAIQMCNKEWASLPGAPYGQPTKSYEACAVVFERAGGILMQGAGIAPPAPSVSTATPESESPAPSQERSTAMPLPVAALIALGTELLNLIPWVKAHPSESGKIVPKLVEVAKAVVPEAPNEQAAVEKVMKDPAKQEAFRSAVASKWSDIAPFLEFEAKERKEAREFAERITSTGPEWKQVGTGALIAVLSLFIIVGGGFLFWDMMYNPNLDPGQKGLILGALLSGFATVIGFWFGSSASGRASGQTVSDIAKGK